MIKLDPINILLLIIDTIRQAARDGVMVASRPIYTPTIMVKFSNGMWWNRDGVHIDWATEAIKSQTEKDSVRCVAVRFYFITFLDSI